MSGDAPIGWLMFFTLAAGILVAAGLFLSFLRSQRNRDIAVNALQGDGHSRSIEASGAGPDLIGLFGIALLIMALLAIGARSQS